MRIIITLMAAVLAAPAARAIPIGPEAYEDPYEFVERVGASARLERALDAVVLIGGRASGVIVSPDGLVMTAAHVLRDLYIGPTTSCPKLVSWLGHERERGGGADSGLTRLECERVLLYEFNRDFALYKVRPPGGRALPYAEIERDPSAIHAGMRAVAAGHPDASEFGRAHKRVSEGEIVLYEPENPELPHFLHLIDTEPGHSGCAILSGEGKLLGIHFRGVPDYSAGVDAVVGGRRERIRRFNVALPVPFLAREYAEQLDRAP